MPKRKKIHKIVIHPNRYLIWALCIALMATIALVAYIRISTILDTQTSVDQGPNTQWLNFQDANLSLRYPSSWLVEEDLTSVSFGTSNQDLFLVSVQTPPDASAYASFAKTSGVEPVTVDGISGILLPKDDTTGEQIAFAKTSQSLFEFRGSTPLFSQILATVKFVKK
ncbi:MAG TPA: hypothetical protein VFX17_00985 [Patescibacteria group bacterium]|nr:hypothetical protein [Patescibacteria group bacterium]